MVLSFLMLGVTAPLLATSALQLSNESQNSKDNSQASKASQELKTEKCHYAARASPRMSDRRKQQLRDCVIVLRDGGFYLKRDGEPGHPLTGYLLPYPDRGCDGLVTTINDDNMLNWVYVDSETYQVKYGVRAEAEKHLTGPMELLLGKDGERRLSFNGWEGFVVVKAHAGEWALYFDKDDNGLREKAPGKAVVEVELVRRGLNQNNDS